jgi:hypothetical protein
VIDSLARQPIMSVGPVTLDVAAQRVLINGWCVHLPAQEAVLLGELMRQPGRAIPTRDLAACLAAFGPRDAERVLRRTKRLTRCLSRRLTVHPLAPTLIEYVENVGFRFTLVEIDDPERAEALAGGESRNDQCGDRNGLPPAKDGIERQAGLDGGQVGEQQRLL